MSDPGGAGPAAEDAAPRAPPAAPLPATPPEPAKVGVTIAVPGLIGACAARGEPLATLIGTVGGLLCLASLTVAPCLSLALGAAGALEARLARRRDEDA